MLRESLKLAEAVAIAVFLLPLFWVIRIVAIMYLTEVDPGLTLSGVPARWLGLAGVLAFCAMSTVLPRAHGRVTFALGLTFAGIAWGLGMNGPEWWTAPGSTWDIRVFWLWMMDRLNTGSVYYSAWVAVAHASAAGLFLAFVGVLLSVVFIEPPLRELRRARQHRGTNRYRSRETVFGDANWSDWRKIRDTVGDRAGIVLGEDYDPRRNTKAFNLRDKNTWGPGGKSELVTLSTGFAGGHSLVFSGTGGGKTAGIVIPTALTYRHPIIFMDPQHEIYETVAKARKEMGFEARVIEIGSGIDLMRFLGPYLRRSPQAYRHVAEALVGKQDAMKSEYSQFYAAQGARLVAALLEVFVAQEKHNVFRELYRLLSQPEGQFKRVIAGFANDLELEASLRTRLAPYPGMESKMFSNLQMSVSEDLNWAAYEEMCDVLDREPASLPDPLGPETDVYIRVSINDLKSFPGIVRSILSALLYAVNEDRDGVERLMIVDEAHQVGKLDGFELIRDTMRKRGLHLMLIYQSTGQIAQAYDKEGVRAWNNSVAARVYGTTEDPTDQAELSKMIGDYTVDIEGRSTSAGWRGFGVGTPSSNRSVNVNLQKANLMRPEQLRTLPDDGLIVFYKGLNPIICGKAFSFRRAEWQSVTPFSAKGAMPKKSKPLAARPARDETAPAEPGQRAESRRRGPEAIERRGVPRRGFNPMSGEMRPTKTPARQRTDEGQKELPLHVGEREPTQTEMVLGEGEAHAPGAKSTAHSEPER